MKHLFRAAAAFAAAALLFLLCACSSRAELSPQEAALQQLAVFFETRWSDSAVSLNGNDEWAAVDLCLLGRQPDSAAAQRFAAKYAEEGFISSASTGDLVRAVLVMRALSLDETALQSAAQELNDRAPDENSIYTMPYVLSALKCAGNYEESCRQLKDRILSQQLESGGWNGFGSRADADTTGPVLMALACYAHEEPVALACSRAAECMAGLYGEDGVVPSSGSSACSTAMLLTGLSALGADTELPLQGLLGLFSAETLFAVRPGDVMSNEQALRAFAACSRPGACLYAPLFPDSEG